MSVLVLLQFTASLILLLYQVWDWWEDVKFRKMLIAHPDILDKKGDV